MARVRFHDSNTERWHEFAELTPADKLDHFSPAELNSRIFVHEMGDDETLQLTEVRYLPNVDIARHAHDADEIFYLVAGELRIGERLLVPGVSVFIARDTLYSLRAGPEGAHFLVFRPTGDLSYVPEKEWRERSRKIASPA